jgi:GNAT superfamily N-acetyltransferase
MPIVTTYYLEMKSFDGFKDIADSEGFHIIEAEIKQYQVNKFLYQLVGESWNWNDKTHLTDEEWKQYAENRNLRTWVAYFKGSIAGYYELQKQEQGDMEIAYLGLVPMFIGKGFGGYLLSHAIQTAWDREKTERLWVHTCTLDHPDALNNYLARGFVIYHEEIKYIGEKRSA